MKKLLLINCALVLIRKKIANVAVLLALVSGSVLAQTSDRLPAYGVDLSQSSVSGLSSGAFMAAQFQTAFSSTLVGAGIVAGGPFYCAGSMLPFSPFVLTATTTCMNPPNGVPPNAALLFEEAKAFASAGLIDDLVGLKRQRVYLFSGSDDKTVITPVVNQAHAFYRLAGLPEENIKYVHDVKAGHAIITNNSNDAACPITQSPFINNCAFMQSHDILRHIYGQLNPPAPQLSGKIIRFNQQEFDRSTLSSMSRDAYLYVPAACETETCKVHVVFHGCEQGATRIGNLYYTTTGYNEMADSNRIIVLYPQVEARSGFFAPFNPKGCWDFWGYSSGNQFAPDFYTRGAPQMAAVRAMLDRLAQPRRN